MSLWLNISLSKCMWVAAGRCDISRWYFGESSCSQWCLYWYATCFSAPKFIKFGFLYFYYILIVRWNFDRGTYNCVYKTLCLMCYKKGGLHACLSNATILFDFRNLRGSRAKRWGVRLPWKRCIEGRFWVKRFTVLPTSQIIPLIDIWINF